MYKPIYYVKILCVATAPMYISYSCHTCIQNRI